MSFSINIEGKATFRHGLHWKIPQSHQRILQVQAVAYKPWYFTNVNLIKEFHKEYPRIHFLHANNFVILTAITFLICSAWLDLCSILGQEVPAYMHKFTLRVACLGL